MTTATATNVGKIVQIIGPVLDVEFATDHLPEIYNALEIRAKTDAGQDIRVTAEVQQHIGRNQVRAVCMSTSDGIVRGMDAIDTGSAIAVPVGAPALGRILNVIGEPVDDAGDIKSKKSYPIHRPTPEFVDQETKVQALSNRPQPNPGPSQQAVIARVPGGAPGQERVLGADRIGIVECRQPWIHRRRRDADEIRGQLCEEGSIRGVQDPDEVEPE